MKQNLVTLPTERLLLRPLHSSDLESVHLYASGPENTAYMSYFPKTKAETARFLENISDRTELQVSLEARMGCGYGACVGCAVDIRESSPDKAEEIITRKKVCKDGPVFDGKAVVW